MGLDAWLETKNGQEIIYWRKENQFHKYFCENGRVINKTEENVGPYCISRKILEDFLNRIDTILAAKLDTPITKKFSNGYTIEPGGKRINHFEELTVEYDEQVAHDLLPTQAGFFFGSTEYTPWYFDSLIKAKTTIENYLKNNPDEYQFIYTSWW